MKKTLVFAIAAIALTSFAQEGVDKIKAEAKADAEKTVEAAKQGLTAQEIAFNKPEVLKKTGGFLDVPAVGTALVFIDTRKKPGAAADEVARVFGDLSKMGVKVEKRGLKEGQCPAELAKELLAAEKGVYALAVTECEKSSALMVLPEDRVVVVNASKLKGGTDPLATETRVIKELWRGLGFVSGIGYPQFKNDVFQPVFSVAELDGLEYQVMQPMNFQKMFKVMEERFGVKRARHIPYRVAVLEGWAPAPTNEYQRIVVEDVKAWKEAKAEAAKGEEKPAEAPAK